MVDHSTFLLFTYCDLHSMIFTLICNANHSGAKVLGFAMFLDDYHSKLSKP